MPESRCLSPHLNLGRAAHPVTTIHLHSDGSWWCWNPDGMVEQGPFKSQALAEEAYRTFTAQLEKPAVSNAVFYKQVFVAVLVVFIYWLIFGRRR